MSRRTPLELKLPLLMSFVLATVLGIGIVAINATLRRAQLTTVSERVLRASRQLAALATVGFGAYPARFAPIAQDSTIRRALRTPVGAAPSISVKAALARAEQPGDSGLPIELWSADGRRLAVYGNDVPVNGRGQDGPERMSSAGRTTSSDGPVTRDPDSPVVTPLYTEGDRVYFWVSVPIREAGKTIGYFRQQRRLGYGPNAIKMLRELSGDSVTLYYRNADARFWTLPTGQALPALHRVNGVTAAARDSSGDRVLYAEERIGLTPIYVGMSVPERTVMVRPRRATNSILLLSAALMFGGVLFAWAIGRSVARPIADITDAAGMLATGDFSTRVPVTGEVEVRRLAHTFNHMAEEIAASRGALEQQTREAQAANRAKSEFLTTMSHELRTPLNAIGGYVDLIEMGLRGPITDEQRRDLQRIKTSQQHLLGLISSVLDLAPRAGRGGSHARRHRQSRRAAGGVEIGDARLRGVRARPSRRRRPREAAADPAQSPLERDQAYAGRGRRVDVGGGSR